MKIGKDYIGVGCGAFILNDNKELLLQKRNKSPEKGYWSIPGGKLEMFETFEQAVKREVKEETDLDIEIVRMNGLCDHIIEAEGLHWVTPSYLCKVVSGTAKIMEPDKHLEMEWFPLDKLPENITITTKKALGEYIKMELREYIKMNVLTKYDANNIGGHGRDHIETVIERCFDIIKEFDLDVDENMIYTIAAFHDIGYKEDPDNHEEVSSRMFNEDKEIAKFFNEEQRKLISEAIVDHRASLEYEARSIYGKIVSSADRETSVENMLKRSIQYQADKHKDENPSVDQVIEYSFKKLSSKYGKGGYAKMYYPDKKYVDYLEEMQYLLENKDKFVAREKEIAKYCL